MLNCIAILLSLNLAFGAFPSCTPDSPVTDGTEQPSTPEKPGDGDKPDTPDPGDKPSEPGENPDPSEPSEPETPDDGILRILAIGNSFSQDAVEQYLYQLFDAAGQKVIIGNLYIGGCSLERHWGNTSNVNRDGYHLEITYGRYTAACTWFEAISGQSVVGNSYAPETVGDFEKQIAQNAAHFAVQKPYEVTEMVDFQKPYTGTPEFSSPVQIDFGAGSAASPEDWNRVAVSTLTGSIYLKGIDGEWSPLVMEKLDGFTGTYNGVGGEPDKPVTIGGVEYPKSVWADGIMVSGTKGKGDTAPAGVTISGFNSAKSYLLKIIAVRFNGSADARCSEYSVKGASESEKQSIWTGMKTYDESADFSKYMVEFPGVRPDSDGRITVSVVGKDTQKAADGHINAMVISEE